MRGNEQETPDALTPPGSGNGAVSSLAFSTAGLDDPFGVWRSILEALFESIPPPGPSAASFDASLVVHHFGTFLLCRSIAAGGRYHRGGHKLIGDDLDHIVISCLLKGRIAFRHSAGGRLRSGDVVIIDLSTPLSFALAGAEVIHLVLPKWALPASVTSDQHTSPRILRRESAMGIFLRGVLEGLAAAGRSFAEREALALSGAVPELLASCLASTAPMLPAGGRGSLRQRLRRHIEENLPREDLSPASIARDLGVSRTQLYRQFERAGGVNTYIRRRRLRRSLLALCDPRHADRRIGDIAYDAGFADEAHFSRLFRQTFGMSPRAARASVRTGSHPGLHSLSPARNDNPSLSDWLFALASG